jgi:hypothetical protein
MNDLLEQAIRETYADQDSVYDTRDAVDRILDHDYHPRTRRRLLWPTVGAASTATVAAVVAALALSSGTPAAYGAWTATPSAAPPAAISAATASCNWHWNHDNPRRFTGNPVLTEARGRYVAAVFVVHGNVWDCVADPSGHGASEGEDGPVEPTPPADKINFPTGSGGGAPGFFPAHRTLTLSGWQQMLLRHVNSASERRQLRTNWMQSLRRGFEYHMFGRAGRAVTSVWFHFDRAKTVKATVENGWYFGWWPRLDMPTSITVTSAAGTVTSDFDPRVCTGKHSCGYARQSTRLSDRVHVQ